MRFIPGKRFGQRERLVYRKPLPAPICVLFVLLVHVLVLNLAMWKPHTLEPATLSMLTHCIVQLGYIYTVSPSPDIYKERLTVQAEFDTLLTDQVTELLVKSRSTYYEQGDKVSE